MTRLRRLLGAVLLGFGTLFQRKARPDDHWATSPTADVLEEAGDESAGGR